MRSGRIFTTRTMAVVATVPLATAAARCSPAPAANPFFDSKTVAKGPMSAAPTAAAVAAACVAPCCTPVSSASTIIGGFDGTTSRLAAILEHNQKFVKNELYKPLNVDPDLHVSMPRCVVVGCMDARLTGLLPAALGLRNGEVKFVKTAGAVVSHPFGSVMRSVLVALYELRASEVYVIGHTDCGMGGLNPDKTIAKMLAAGVPQERLAVLESVGIDVKSFLRGFKSLDESVVGSADAVRNHPLVPPHVRVHALIVDSNTGALRLAKRSEVESPAFWGGAANEITINKEAPLRE